MKKSLILLTALCLAATLTSAGQGKIPAFRMYRHDGTVFKATQLPLGKPVMIYYFSPDCEDCQKFTTEMLSRIKELSNVSIAMITYQSVQEVAKYVKKNHLTDYANIYAGTEGSSLFVRNYYDINKFPFVAIFTKNGSLIKTYTSTEVSVSDMLLRLKSSQ